MYRLVSLPFLKSEGGHLGGSVLKHLPSAQVMILGSWDRAPVWALCSAGSLLVPLLIPLPQTPLSLFVSLSLKIFKILFKIKNRGSPGGAVV